MIQHIFEYLPHSKTVYNREYVCKCKTCINLNFSSGLEEYKRVNLDETDKEVAVAGSTEVEVENDCELGNVIIMLLEYTNLQRFLLKNSHNV